MSTMNGTIRERRPDKDATKSPGEVPRRPAKTRSRTISDAAIRAGKALATRLWTWHELPEWYQDNEYILTGFRPISNSYRTCLRSVFEIHNQTGNIYSHALGSLWMLGLAFWLNDYARTTYSDISEDDYLVFSLCFMGSITCFAVSAVYHTLSNHSCTTSEFCLKLDFLGIIGVTAGYFPPGLWYTFPCMDRDKKLGLIGINLFTQAMMAIFVLFVKAFQSRAWRPLRGLLFTLMASSAFYPIITASYQRGYGRADAEAGASFYVLAVVTYLTFTMIYVARVPERLKPGTFDIWGHSHQLFHIGMVAGVTVHLFAFVQAFDHYHSMGRCSVIT